MGLVPTRTHRVPMLIGAHVSTEGGISTAPERASRLGAETFQVFTRNKRRWHEAPYPRDEIAGFRDGVATAGLREPVVHGSYLVNLAAAKPDVYRKSKVVFADEYARCRLLRIPYLNFHPGAHVGTGERVGLENVIESVADILDAQPDNPTMLLVENTVHRGSVLGYTFEQCAQIIDGIDDKRMGLCLDTAHAFAEGHDHRTREGYERLLERINDTVGLDKVRAVHLNDSREGLGQHIDRHEGIGKGHIGLDLFRFLVNDYRFEGVPGNLETRDPERWPREVRMLKEMRREEAPDRPHGRPIAA